MAKKLLAAILSLTLAITCFPTAGVLYAEAGSSDEATVANTVAVASALALQTAINEGKKFIEISEDFSVDETVYITSSVTVYASEDAVITREEGFTGDMFVVGETADGKNCVVENGEAVILNIGLSSGDAKLTLDGGNVESAGTCIFVKNHSDVNIYGNVTVQNFKKTGNSSVGSGDLTKGTQVGGAAVIIASGAMNLYGATFTQNTVAVTDGAVSSLGGAIYNFGTLKIFDATFTGCTAYIGGAVYNYRTVQIMNGSFEDNSANYGAAIAQADSQYAQTVMGNSSECADGILFADNTAESCGGCFYSSYSSSSGGTISSNGLTVYSDAKATFRNNKAGSNGGAIYTYCTVYIDGASFIGNSASSSSNGGGACSFQSGGNEYVLKNCTFTGNTAVGNGGAIYVHGCDCTAYNCNFTENSADYRGGAVYVAADGSIAGSYTVFDNTYTKNSSVDRAGAIAYTSETNCRIYRSEFTENQCDAEAGAVWVYTGKTGEIIQECKFIKNTALGTTGGGAISCSNSGTGLSLFNITATENTAPNGLGGFYYTTTTGVTTNIKGLTYSGNTAANSGNLIFANTYKVVINADKSSAYDAVTEDLLNWTFTKVASGKADLGVKSGTLTVNDFKGTIPEIPSDGETAVSGEIVASDDTDIIFNLAEATPETDESYNPGESITDAGDFCSTDRTSYEIENIGTVTADTFIYEAGGVTDNPTVGEGLLIFRAMQYKKANPTEDVRIDLSAYRISPETAVNINPDSPYYGYLRSLKSAESDEYGFVRISYLLVTAAKMGIEVNIIGQRAATGDALYFADYFDSHMADACDADYAEGKAVRDYLTCTEMKWDYTTKASADLMHTKACAVSAYLDSEGRAHGKTVWLSSTNLDNIKDDGNNGYDALQTGIIISDHEGIYRTTVNYLNLVRQYSERNEVYLFRNLVNKLNKEQIDTLNAGLTLESDEQIVYRDDVFELYFSAIGGDYAKWDDVYNPISSQINALAESDGYILFGMNNPKFRSFAWSETAQAILADAFDTNRNAENRIEVNIGTVDEDSASEASVFNSTVYDTLTEGTDIGYKSFNEENYRPIHSKDMLFSYSLNGVRSYVTLITSMNLHEGSVCYQSNFALVIKENNCNNGSIFRTVAENSFDGLLKPELDASKIALSQTEYTYTGDPIEPEIISDTYTPDDYTVAYENNLTAGTGKVTVTGKGDYSGTVTFEFNIATVDIGTLASQVSVLSQLYTGKALAPAVSLTLNGKTLEKDKDYTVSYANNTEPGENATVTVTGINNFTGSFTKNFIISKDMIGDHISITPISDVIYNGKNQEPDVTVNSKDGGSFDASNYVVSYNNGEAHSDCGKVTVTVSGTGLYFGSVSTFFRILPLDVSTLEFAELNDVSYNGTAFEPEITLLTEGVELQKDVDYTVSYSSNINAGEAQVTVTGIGNCTGNKVLTFNINSIPAEEITATVDDTVYSGEALEPEITAIFGEIELTSDDYDAVYSDNLNAGTGSVTINFKGNFSGSVTKEFTIEKADIEDADISSVAPQYYTGSNICPEPTVILNGITLVKDTDYTVSYFNNKTVSSNAVVIVRGIGNYTGETGRIFSVVKDYDISKARVSLVAYVVYNGKAQTPAVTVTHNGENLIKGTDYTLSYSDNTNPGTAKVTVTGKGNYSGSQTVYFEISPSYNLTYATVENIAAVTYNAKAQKPAVKVTMAGTELQQNTDYTVTYTNNTNPGNAKVTVTGKGNYSGSQTVYFEISPSYNLTYATVENIAAVTYNAKAQKPAVKVTMAGTELQQNTDYTVTYTDNTNPGTAKVTVTGKGNYSGSQTVYFEISPSYNLTYATVENIATVTYNAKAQKPAVKVTMAGTELQQNTDYTVTYTNNTNPGTAKVTVKGKGNYSGTITKTFTVKTTNNLAYAVIGSISAKTYTGSAIKPTVTVTLLGTKLTLNKDYKVTYSNNTKASASAKVTVTGIGNYTGKLTKTFTIKKAALKSLTVTSAFTYTGKKLTPKVTFGNKTLASTEYSIAYYSDSAAKNKVSTVKNVGVYYVKITSKAVNFASGSRIVKLTVSPKTTAIKSITAVKAGFTVKWTAQSSGATGYQIRYSLNKNMTNATVVTVGNIKTVQKNVTKLKNKTTYYVQIRTVTKVGKTNYYSGWSTVKSVKTK